MSIASEITSMGENLKKDYQSIANLGADLTNVDKNIENIAELLDGVYDVLPKTSFQEGTDVTIEGGLKGKIDFDDGKVGFGQASQESTQGYQLWSLKDGTYSQNGAVAKVQNGEITLSGTTTAIAFIDIPLNNTMSWQVDQAYIISANNSSSSQVRIRINNTGSADTFLDSANVTKTFTYTTSAVPDVFTNRITLRIQDGVTFTNFKLKPMLETGTTAHDWEQYTGGYASPSPNWEQTIQCVTGEQSIVESDGNNNSITYPISLGNNKFYNIGDYADELLYDVDEDKVYKNEKIRKIVLNGSESWAFNSTSTLYVYTGITEGYQTDFSIAPLILSNYYISKDFNSLYSASEDYGISYGASSTDRFCIRNADITSVADFKTWLSTHNVSVYYILKNAVKAEITDTTLKAQVKALYNAQTLKGTTVITSNGDLPMIIKVRALKGE